MTMTMTMTMTMKINEYQPYANINIYIILNPAIYSGCCSYCKFNNNIVQVISKCLDWFIITLSQIMNFLIAITLQ